MVNHLLLPTQIGITRYFATSATQAVTHTYGLRSQNSNRHPRFVSKCKVGEKSIQFKGSQVWKAMPLDLKNCEPFSKFKASYKNYLLETEIDPTIFFNETDLLVSSLFALSLHTTSLIVLCPDTFLLILSTPKFS